MMIELSSLTRDEKSFDLLSFGGRVDEFDNLHCEVLKRVSCPPAFVDGIAQVLKRVFVKDDRGNVYPVALNDVRDREQSYV